MLMDWVLRYPDVIGYVGLIVVWLFAWKDKKVKKQNVNERTLGANVIGSFVSSGLTAASILIPAAFVIVQIGYGNSNFPRVVLDEVRFAFYWFVASISFGVFNAARFPTSVGEYNVSSDPKSNVLGAMQLFAVLMGVFRMTYAIWLLGK